MLAELVQLANDATYSGAPLYGQRLTAYRIETTKCLGPEFFQAFVMLKIPDLMVPFWPNNRIKQRVFLVQPNNFPRFTGKIAKLHWPGFLLV